MTFSKKSAFWGAALALVAGGCSSVSVNRELDKHSPVEIWSQLCPSESALARVQGEVWMKLDSKEMNGQFPAGVKVEPSALALEVTNLVGAPQAWIKIAGEKREIRLSPENQKKYRVDPLKESWGGIPLALATDLFRTGWACPHGQALEFYRNGETLQVREPDPVTKTNRLYEYRLVLWGEKVRAESMRYEAMVRGKPWGVTLTFQDFEDPHGLAKRWTASSDRGTIEARWKSRRVFSAAELN